MSGKREIRSVDVGSVFKVTFVLTLCLFAIALVGLVALYLLGLVSGGLGGVEGFIASLGFSGFRFTILPFVLAFVLVGVLSAAVMALVAAVLTLLYNHVQPLVGGIMTQTRDR